jgi:5-methylcytosine-specific restriction endonuclease McrA
MDHLDRRNRRRERHPPRAGTPHNGRGIRTVSIGKSLRFEVLRRDGFACTYCGRKPPDVELHIDHVIPSWRQVTMMQERAAQIIAESESE